MAEQSRAARLLEETLLHLLLTLRRGYEDPIRPNIRTQGMEERDLAFEADLLNPAETELSIYATQKRNRVLRLLREMSDRGWVELQPTPPLGAYHILLKPQGAEYASQFQLPQGIGVLAWLKALVDRLLR